ncbi:hypothetical protein BB561_003749 [Smittium simulii]|uniref:Uncharacterized protein n=1 Tax=Smittium simulii TaxID=133385 RepID=A0A2T9YJR6_9FUNG|nr:hypothetical protein BB561_003749 [Smittium simulii]
MTKPIDDYAHRKLKSSTTKIQDNEDLEFAHSMRELLSNTAFSTTFATAHTPINSIPNTAKNAQTSQSQKEKTRALSKTTNASFQVERQMFVFQLCLGKTRRQQMGQKNSREGNAITKEFASFLKKKTVKQTSGSSKTLLRKDISNGITDIHMQDYQEKRLHELSGLRGRFLQILIHQKEYKEIILQTKPTGVEDQDTEVQYDTISIDYLSGDDDKLTNYEFKISTRQSQTMLISLLPGCLMLIRLLDLKKKFKGNKIIDCNNDSKQSSNLEFRILEAESAKMEWSIVSTRDSRNGNLYQCQRHGMGNSCCISVLFRIVTSIDSISPHKCQGIISSIQLRQDYNYRISLKILGDYLSQITRSFRETVVSLYKDKHTPSDGLFTNVNQPCRRTIKADGSARMVLSTETLKKLNKTSYTVVHVKSYTTASTEGSAQKNNNDNNNANVKVGNLVSDSRKN